VRDCGWGLEDGEGRPREAEIRVSMADGYVQRVCALSLLSRPLVFVPALQSSEGKWRRRKLEGRHLNGACSLGKDGAVLSSRTSFFFSFFLTCSYKKRDERFKLMTFASWRIRMRDSN
jgi:hypothetical protein